MPSVRRWERAALRLIQQLMFETIILALGGGLAGLVVAKFGVDLIVKFLARAVAQSYGDRPGWQRAGFTLGFL